MSNWLASVLTLEGLAVVLAIAYLLLATRQSLWCWVCAFISSALYTVIFWDVNLFMESALNVYYVVMAGVGYWQWRYGSSAHTPLQIRCLGWKKHVLLVASMLVLALLNGVLMQRYTTAAWPFVDAFTTWASVITTWLVVRKVPENWLYWLVIDSISIYLYVDRGLYMTAALFAGYVVIVIFGYRQWRREYQAY